MQVRPILCEEAPSIEIRGANVVLIMDNYDHPDVAVPTEIMRRWCEDTLLQIDEWERERASRVLPFARKRGAGRADH